MVWKNKQDGVTVTLQIKLDQDQDQVKISVSDNGYGMTPERLEEVTQLITAQEEPARSRIGLRNVHQRLILCYGENAGLNITSNYGKGTEIVFYISLNENKNNALS